jgi:hypothetical protein
MPHVELIDITEGDSTMLSGSRADPIIATAKPKKEEKI